MVHSKDMNTSSAVGGALMPESETPSCELARPISASDSHVLCNPQKILAKDALLLEEFPVDLARAAVKSGAAPSITIRSTKKGIPKPTAAQRLARAAACIPSVAGEILRQVECLSTNFFQRNIPLHAGWKLSILVDQKLKGVLDNDGGACSAKKTDENDIGEHQHDNSSHVLVLAIISFRVKQNVSAMEISKVAVLEEVQRMGLGKLLVMQVVNVARRMDGVRFTSLSSLEESVPFYSRIGFANQGPMQQVVTDEDKGGEEYEAGQVHMEIEFRGKRTGHGGKYKGK